MTHPDRLGVFQFFPRFRLFIDCWLVDAVIIRLDISVRACFSALESSLESRVDQLRYSSKKNQNAALIYLASRNHYH